MPKIPKKIEKSFFSKKLAKGAHDQHRGLGHTRLLDF